MPGTLISSATRLVQLLAILALTQGLVASQSSQLRIYQIDVQQADAALIVSPHTNTMLIDSGLGGSSAQRIKSLMDKLGLTKIDHLVTSHYHGDHYGGVKELVTSHGVDVVNAYDRGAKPFLGAKTNDSDFKTYQTNLGFRAKGLKPGDTIDLDPAMTVQCIASSGAVIGEQNPVLKSGKDDENDNSVALLITFGGFRYFTAGDIERRTETNIARHLVLNVDACKASHHGAETSSALELMSELNPTVIIISNGDHNGFHHPRRIILERYKTNSPQAKVFQTNKYTKTGPQDPGGNVPDEFIGDLESVDDDGTILITVAPSTSQFFVSWRSKVQPFTIKDSGPASIVIESLLPRPSGPDSTNEQVTLKHQGTITISLAGWVLRDLTGNIWKLDSAGQINPGETKTFTRNGMAMSLNDNGDTVFLIAPDGNPKDHFQYDGSDENVLITTGH